MRTILTMAFLYCVASVLPTPLDAPLFKGYQEKRAAEGHADPSTAKGRALRGSTFRVGTTHHTFGPFDPEADQRFYDEHDRQVLPAMPSDDQLGQNPDIHHYPFNPQVGEVEQERLHAEFAKKRVRAKKYERDAAGNVVLPNITEPAVEFIQNQQDFVKDFVIFFEEAVSSPLLRSFGK